jgi:hypothetical protein
LSGAARVEDRECEDPQGFEVATGPLFDVVIAIYNGWRVIWRQNLVVRCAESLERYFVRKRVEETTCCC